MPVIFHGQDVRVRYAPASSAETLLVTFDYRSTGRQKIKSPGFGAAFCEKYGVPAIHFTASRRHWWLCQEMAGAVDRAADIASGFRRVVAYGTSMGAYGALTHSSKLGADAVLALSALYSIDPAKMPREKRWQEDLPGLDLSLDNMAEGICPTADVLVTFDPASPDVRHARKIAKISNRVTLLPIRYSGHETATFLAKSGVLSALVNAGLDGTLDLPTIRRQIRSGRRAAPEFWRRFALRASVLGHSALGLEAARQALVLAPDHRTCLATYARLLLAAGDTEEAVNQLKRAVALRPNGAGLQRLLREAQDHLAQRFATASE